MARYIRYYLNIHALELGEFPAVETAAKIARMFIYNNKDFIQGAFIVSGWDPAGGYQTYEVTIGGTLSKKKFVIAGKICPSKRRLNVLFIRIGSGSSFIYGFCDDLFRENMSKAECKEFCRKAVSYATYRDTSSGGVIRIVDITKDGVTRDYFTHDQKVIR